MACVVWCLGAVGCGGVWWGRAGRGGAVGRVFELGWAGLGWAALGGVGWTGVGWGGGVGGWVGRLGWPGLHPSRTDPSPTEVSLQSVTAKCHGKVRTDKITKLILSPLPKAFF